LEVHFTPEWEAKLNEMATATGRPADDLLQDAMAGYFEELTQAREMLDSRYDDLKSGKVKPVGGEAFFENLRQREAELLKKHTH
jgi:hypothetical protein